MSQELERLLEILSVEALAGDGEVFRGLGSENDGAEATYGGHFLGQATRAALMTVPQDKGIHSMHGYFLRGGIPGEPIDYHVTRVRDGRSFCTRRVSAMQGGKVAFEMTASFTVTAEGSVIDPDLPEDFHALPAPDSLPRYPDLMAAQDPLPFPAEWALREHGVDVRTINAPWSPNGPSPDDGIRLWVRADGAMPDDPALHSSMLAYQSDESISDNVLIPFDVTWGDPNILFVSLDHAMWFHRPFRMDDWLLVEQRATTLALGRGLATGRVWRADGSLVASFTQEALFRR